MMIGGYDYICVGVKGILQPGTAMAVAYEFEFLQEIFIPGPQSTITLIGYSPAEYWIGQRVHASFS